MPRRRKRTQQVEPVPGQSPHGSQAEQERQIEQVQQAVPRIQTPVVPLGAPSERPDEPVTSGLSTGPGSGPESLRGMAPGLSGAEEIDIQLRALYSAFPNDDVLALIEHHQRRLPPPSAPLA